MDDHDTHQQTLADLRTALEEAGHDVAVFDDPDNPGDIAAGHTALAALWEAATGLAVLISELADAVERAEAHASA